MDCRLDWLDTFFITIAIGLLVWLISRFIKSDCDFVLQIYERIGRQPDRLKNKVVWITGASSGIGEALAYRLAEAGCKLILSARRIDRLHSVRQRCLDTSRASPENIFILPLNLLDFNSHKDVVDIAVKQFHSVDVLVNNAGRSQRALWEKTSFEVDRQILEVNTLGPLSLTKALLPHMIKQKSGHIVVTSSLAGKFGAPGLGSYSGSKHALHGWFDSLRIEGNCHNISVTMVCPGPVFSEALLHAFTDNTEQPLGIEMNQKEKRMPASRCAHLMAIAIANKLDEVWITGQPELFYTYLFQYCPFMAHFVAKKLGQKRLDKVKDGKKILH